MKKTDHLPVYGVGPLCVYSMVLLLIVGIVLRCLGILDIANAVILKIPMIVVGVLLIALGIYMWVKAVIISKISDKIIENHLETEGIYAWVRNPIYSAIAIALTGISFLFFNYFLLILPLLFWIDITLFMIFSEEKWLYGLYGEEYKEYCKNVNRCIPWFPKKKKG